MERASIFDIKLHIKYVERCRNLLPHYYTSEDLNHLALANFALSSLDLLDASPRGDQCVQHTEWIYQHMLPSSRGFRGSLHAHIRGKDGVKYDPPQLPATYFALISLVILGDSLSRIDREQIMLELQQLQRPDGSFMPNRFDQGTDIRFTYMAIAVRHVLRIGHEVAMDIDCHNALAFLSRCRNSDGGYAQEPGAESHSGLTFCALAAKSLSQSDSMMENHESTIDWLVHRQNRDGGFNGRVGKDSDVCYCFWNISALALLESVNLIDAAAVSEYLAKCQTVHGGYGKAIGDTPDLFHSYVGIAVQTLLNQERINLECCALSISPRALRQFRAQNR